MKINELYNKNEEITLNSYLTKCGVKDISKFIEANYIEPYDNYDNIDKCASDLLSYIKGDNKYD